VIALIVENELAFAGLHGALALVKGFGGGEFAPGRKIEVPSFAYDVPTERKAPAYLIAEPGTFDRALPDGVLLAVALHDYEIDMDGNALVEEVRTRVPDGLSWL
jgi:hypothetical protein